MRNAENEKLCRWYVMMCFMWKCECAVKCFKRACHVCEVIEWGVGIFRPKKSMGVLLSQYLSTSLGNFHNLVEKQISVTKFTRWLLSVKVLRNFWMIFFYHHAYLFFSHLFLTLAHFFLRILLIPLKLLFSFLSYIFSFSLSIKAYLITALNWNFFFYNFCI